MINCTFLGVSSMGWYERRVLPILLDKMMTGAETVRLRKDALAQARGRVPEIGFGTGLNVPHYPPAVTHLVGVDPNSGMEKLARQRSAEGRVRPQRVPRSSRAGRPPQPQGDSEQQA